MANDKEYHAIANIFPLLDGDDLQELVNDIGRQGLLQPVVLFEGKILDGRNRYRACRLASVEPRYAEFNGTPEEAIGQVWSLNIPRRHLTSDQRACCDALRNKLLDSYREVREAAKQRQVATLPTKGKKGFQNVPEKVTAHKADAHEKGETREARAKAAKTNTCYISLADRLLKDEPEVFAQVQKGEKRLKQVSRERKEKPQVDKSKSKNRKAEPPQASIVTRHHDACIRLAAEGRPLSVSEIRAITGCTNNSLDKFLTRCMFIPWLKVSPPDSDHKRQFFINEELKKICDGGPIDSWFFAEGVKRLYREVNDRLEERDMNIRARGWTHDAINKIELLKTLQLVGQRLRELINSGELLQRQAVNSHQSTDSLAASLNSNHHTPASLAESQPVDTAP